jgi:tryptophanyl-tRNA synthetase
LEIFAACSGRSVEELCEEFRNVDSTLAFKEALARSVCTVVDPIRERVREMMSKPTEIDAVLEQGRQKAAEIAERTMREVQHIVGLHDK